MGKCVGNCAVCTMNVDKMACCMVQLLRNMIEIKKMIKAKEAVPDDIFKGLEEIESEEAGETGLDAPGTAEACKE